MVNFEHLGAEILLQLNDKFPRGCSCNYVIVGKGWPKIKLFD